MWIVINLLVNSSAVYITAHLLPDVTVSSFFDSVVVAIVLGIVNAVIKPVLVILTLPITFVTLGLFYFVINALLILLVGRIVPGFAVDGFIPALLFSVVLSLVNWFLHSLAKEHSQ